MFKYLSILILLFFSLTTQAQQTLGSKLNRFIPFDLEGVSSGYNEINPVLSPDKNTLFFSRINHPENHYGASGSQDIWYSVRIKDDIWSEPKRVDASFNNSRYNALFSVTDNGEYLVSGIYSKNGKYKRRGLSITMYDSALNRWLNPLKLKVPKYKRMNKGLASSAYMNKTGDVLVLSYTNHWQSEKIKDIRFSTKKPNGKWGSLTKARNKTAKKLFKSIEAPYLSDDEKTLYFSAYLKGKENEYQNDIYKMERIDHTYKEWSAPELISETINTENWENYYREFNDGNWAVFSSASVGKGSNIAMVKLNEPRPYIDLSGLVFLEGQPMQEGYQVVINGQVVDSVRIDTVASNYAVRLPFGQKYEIQARATERVAKVEIIDATNQLEYIKVDRDLQLSLIPFLDLSGIVMVDSVPLREPFEILINGQLVDSVSTDFATGEYSVRLPLEQEYKLYAKSGYYIPDTLSVSVLYDTVQVQQRENIMVAPTPYVDVTGRLINIRTDSLISPEALPQLALNGIVADSIDTSNGTYKIRLPWGQKYLFTLQAEEFDPIVTVVDLQDVTNYQKIERNLYAAPLEKYALVTGKVIDKETGLPVKSSFFIDVDGSRSTSSEIDETSGTYSVRLSLGKKSILTASADSYFPVAEIVDVTDEIENVELTQDLILVPLKVGEAILLNNITFETA
ncbi:MAG: hypothetical protein ABFS32_04945, partial [Bacteroidota bacterium]